MDLDGLGSGKALGLIFHYLALFFFRSKGIILHCSSLDQKEPGQNDLTLIQTLHHASKEKTEA